MLQFSAIFAHFRRQYWRFSLKTNVTYDSFFAKICSILNKNAIFFASVFGHPDPVSTSQIPGPIISASSSGLAKKKRLKLGMRPTIHSINSKKKKIPQK
jgi:hypothetical protein